MAETKFIERDGKQILLMDFASIDDAEELRRLVDETIRLVHSAGRPHSVLALLDLSGTRIDRTVLSSMKRMSRSNGPYIKFIAFVGFPGFWSLVMRVVIFITGRFNHKVIPQRQEALDWLAVVR